MSLTTTKNTFALKMFFRRGVGVDTHYNSLNNKDKKKKNGGPLSITLGVHFVPHDCCAPSHGSRETGVGGDVRSLAYGKHTCNI